MSSITLRFLAEPSTVNFGGKVHGGTVMKWIDEAGYACATSWSKRYCVTVFIGSIRFHRPIMIGDLVEVEARLAYTGNSSMNISVEVRSGDMKGGEMQKTTECLVVFVSVDSHGRPLPVDAFTPGTPGEMALAERARLHLEASRAAVAGPRGPEWTANAAPEGLSSGGGQHRPADLAQADAHRACALAVAAQDQRVAVFQEGAALAVGQRDRLLAAQRELQQRAGLVRLRARQRAGAEQVARLQVAAVAPCGARSVAPASSRPPRVVLPRVRRTGASPASRIFAVCSQTSSVMSSAPRSRLAGESR